MTTLELRGQDAELHLKLLSTGDLRARRTLARSFLVQIKPWLKYFKEPTLSHSDHGFIRERPIGRSRVKLFKSNPISTLPGAFGYKIRRKRIELGLTQLKLAETLNMNRCHLSDLERGIHLPSAKTRLALEKILKMNFQNKIHASLGTTDVGENPTLKPH